MRMNIREIVGSTDRYNLHSHTQFCDGHAPMEEMAAAAAACGMLHYGITPHSPICVQSPCNMPWEAVKPYLECCDVLKEKYSPAMKIWTGMEIDYISPDWGPHIDRFQKLPLDYTIGSVHFVPNQDGVAVDCDGSQERFNRNLRDAFAGDLRYVVERYFEQVLLMIERGGFDILGHLDKIAANASGVDPEIESRGWYQALVSDVVEAAVSSSLVVEINTKSLSDRKRFFPSLQWWPMIIDSRCVLAVNSDAHWPDRIEAGRAEAFEKLSELKQAEGKTDK